MNEEVIDVAELSPILDEVLDLRTLKQRLSTKSGDDIGFWSPRYGKSFIYSDRIPKGQIIEVRSCKIKRSPVYQKHPLGVTHTYSHEICQKIEN